ncbi:hypothetical protein EJ05DRAFT_318192 [Pseudovirgaria hyperparasitica]|uniref:Uncharacterized protein n=1 Tax=Pseudovirgaria hyperparasitica TaxID=470096 RepID=A0A6A6WD57_9PEZI|nr:uncharacterized protein EJ05DRAFT_318192 [Pseudovirgaria hyperparasitica]KAF2759994.1 hypothetical protein EJ05DRAFT_318192 [Pseudovirgaria hyperparasitica]
MTSWGWSEHGELETALSERADTDTTTDTTTIHPPSPQNHSAPHPMLIPVSCPMPISISISIPVPIPVPISIPILIPIPIPISIPARITTPRAVIEIYDKRNRTLVRMHGPCTLPIRRRETGFCFAPQRRIAFCTRRPDPFQDRSVCSKGTATQLHVDRCLERNSSHVMLVLLHD